MYIDEYQLQQVFLRYRTRQPGLIVGQGMLHLQYNERKKGLIKEQISLYTAFKRYYILDGLSTHFTTIKYSQSTTDDKKPSMCSSV